MKKILLTYSTVDGHTKTICEKILSYSKTSQVDILPIDSSINIKDYDTVVIGQVLDMESIEKKYLSL